MSHKAILVVSYGSSYKQERENAIGGIESAIANAFPNHRVYRAFTSVSIIESIEKKEGIRVDTVSQALERVITDGITELTIIQTHLIQEMRHEKLLEMVERYKTSYEKICVVEPILSCSENIEVFADGVQSLGCLYEDEDTAICCVGHGIDTETNAIYQRIQKVLQHKGHANYYVGTLSVRPTLSDLLEQIKSKEKYHRVVILPLMLVSGYHVRKDLMGPNGESWKNVFKRAGFQVECIAKGLGEEAIIQNVYAEYLKSVIL